MKPYYQNELVTLYHDSNENHIPKSGQYDCFLSDPPFGINAARHRKSQSAGWVDYGSAEEGKWDTSTPAQETLDALRDGGKIQIIWVVITLYFRLVRVGFAGTKGSATFHFQISSLRGLIRTRHPVSLRIRVLRQPILIRRSTQHRSP